MTHTRTLSAIAFALVGAAVIAIPATAFFSELDGLKQMIASADASPEEGLTDLVEQLNKPAASHFVDIKGDEWYSQFVSAVVDWGIVSGYRDDKGALTGKYGAADNVTKSQMIKMALKAAQKDESQCTAELPPAFATHWGKTYISCAMTMKMRIIDAQFNPDAPATRAEVLGIIHDAFGKKVPPLFSNFTDARGNPYERDIAYAAINGIVTGDTDAQGNPLNQFRPQAGINRGEAAKILYKALEVYAAM